MGDWTRGLESLSEAARHGLAAKLDNAKCGWKRLAAAARQDPQFRYSESELTNCSLQVLNCAGSPGRFLLDMLAQRECSLGFLLQCLKDIENHEAVDFLTAAVGQIVITAQPQPQLVPEGATVALSCMANGPPDLGFQWFKGKEEVPGGNTRELVLINVTEAQQGHYICRVNHGENCLFSKWAHVRLANSKNSPTACFSASGLQVIYQPKPQTLSEGDRLHLECFAEANPPPQFMWYHNRKPIPMKHSLHLQVSCVTTADRGMYRCRAYNLYHEMWSEEVYVDVGPNSLCGPTWNVESEGNFPQLPQHNKYTTDKVALLIGNMNYLHHRQLRAPMADVHELTNLLRQLDFKVVSLLDLNWQEMHSAVTEFLLLLDRGVYALLYFAGHGYENFGNSFMVPIDAPASYTSENCLWVQGVLKRMQERETGLNVFLLDMCRKRNLNDAIIPKLGPLKVTANTVFGYATCVDAEAYEVNKDDLSNGIFMSFLKKRLMEDEKVTVMLDRVAEDMGQCKITRGRQALELLSNLSERRALTDHILNSDCPVTTSARNLQWAIAHVLPECHVLQFECGVKVQLGFAAEFSNIMIIYTCILEKPNEIVSCSAQLSDFPEDVEIDLKHTNEESLQEAESLLFTAESLPESKLPKLYTRLRALQQLKKELRFTVCLHYQYSNLDEDVQERQTISVGKPLVSKLNLHEPRRQPNSMTSSFDYNLVAEGASFTEVSSFAGTSSGSSSTLWSFDSEQRDKSTHPPSAQVNFPEENLESDESQANLTSKSLPNSFRFSNMKNFYSL
uniref:Uncharacterized protein n=1 Tax=Denticeps clupeoides TaxID=299321 RepID=A0AAY4DC79_9TELE